MYCRDNFKSCFETESHLHLKILAPALHTMLQRSKVSNFTSNFTLRFKLPLSNYFFFLPCQRKALWASTPSYIFLMGVAHLFPSSQVMEARSDVLPLSIVDSKKVVSKEGYREKLLFYFLVGANWKTSKQYH